MRTQSRSVSNSLLNQKNSDSDEKQNGTTAKLLFSLLLMVSLKRIVEVLTYNFH